MLTRSTLALNLPDCGDCSRAGAAKDATAVATAAAPPTIKARIDR